MIKHSQRQTGSALIVVIIILAVAIIASLGFVLWNRYLAPKKTETTQTTTPSKTQEPTKTAETTQTYQNSAYSFQYPKDNWTVSEIQYGTGDDSSIIPTARTANWAQEGPGLSSGAEVSINVTSTTQTLAEMKSSTVTNNGGGKDVSDTQVAGVAAFSYNSAYEGVRYHTVFIKDNQAYDIIYRYADNGQPDTYIAGYNEIVSSFSFK